MRRRRSESGRARPPVLGGACGRVRTPMLSSSASKNCASAARHRSVAASGLTYSHSASTRPGRFALANASICPLLTGKSLTTARAGAAATIASRSTATETEGSSLCPLLKAALMLSPSSLPLSASLRSSERTSRCTTPATTDGRAVVRRPDAEGLGRRIGAQTTHLGVPRPALHTAPSCRCSDRRARRARPPAARWSSRRAATLQCWWRRQKETSRDGWACSRRSLPARRAWRPTTARARQRAKPGATR